MNIKYLIIPVMAFCMIWLTGCTNIAIFDYGNAQGTTAVLREKGSATKTITVVPFLDQRGIKYYDPQQTRQAAAHPAFERGSFYWGFFPVLTSGYVEKEEPENSEDFVSLGRFHFNASADLAKAAAVSLQASNLFKDVVVATGKNQTQTDYIWRGTVKNTCYKGHIYSYCITYFLSPALWVIGFPYGSSTNELWVSFELVERATGKVLWTFDCRGRDYIVHWLYARVGKDVSLYPSLMRQAMNAALYDLSKKIPEL
ncbi:MAG: hypothetical protein IJW05_02810 [Lentisphaeria bacterium]|nr:hypothetical protein [Lentisphaeria bacterium]